MSTTLDEDLEQFAKMTAGTLWKMKNFPYQGADDAFVLITDNSDQCKPALISFVSHDGESKVGTTSISFPFSTFESYLPATADEARSVLPEFKRNLAERVNYLRGALMDAEIELTILEAAESEYGQ